MHEYAILLRPTRADEAHFLPDVERSAGEAFRAIPELAWVADDDVTDTLEHRRLVDLGTSWVAVAGEQHVGFICAERFGPDLHVWLVAVRREAQGRGIGAELMQVVIEHAVESGAARLTLTTFRGVPWNEPFYRHLGFEAIEVGDLDERLRRVLAEEAAAGFAAERRCAMCMSVIPSE